MCYLESLLFRENMPSAITFANSNKSERNINKKVQKAREKCLSRGINVGNEIVVSKAPKSDNCSSVGFERTLIYGKEKRTEGIVERQGNV